MHSEVLKNQLYKKIRRRSRDWRDSDRAERQSQREAQRCVLFGFYQLRARGIKLYFRFREAIRVMTHACRASRSSAAGRRRTERSAADTYISYFIAGECCWPFTMLSIMLSTTTPPIFACHRRQSRVPQPARLGSPARDHSRGGYSSSCSCSVRLAVGCCRLLPRGCSSRQPQRC